MECNQCNVKFTAQRNLTRHVKRVHGNLITCPLCKFDVTDIQQHNKTHHGNHVCCICSTTFQMYKRYVNHLKTHKSEHFTCDFCKKELKTKKLVKKHILSRHIDYKSGAFVKASLNGVVKDYKFLIETVDPSLVFSTYKDRVADIIKRSIRRYRGVKWGLSVMVEFYRQAEIKRETTASWFNSCMQRNMNEIDINDHYNSACAQILAAINNFESLGSGWQLGNIPTLIVKTCKYNPLNGSRFISLPKSITEKKAVLNIQNDDEFCFSYCILAQLHPVDRTDNANRVSHYKRFLNELNMGGINSPVKITSIPKFEKQNPSISVNVFGFEEEKDRKLVVYPLHISKNENSEHKVNLLYVSNEGGSHYCLIRNFSRLMGYENKHGHTAHYCYYCLRRFSTSERLKNHKPMCEVHDPQRVSYGEPGEVIKFSKPHLAIPSSYRIYGDFESLMKVCSENGGGSNTENLYKHEPSGYAMVIIDGEGNLFEEPTVYRGENAAEHFLTKALEAGNRLLKIIKDIKPIKMSVEDEILFEKATECALCECKFSEDVVKVRDHSHQFGNYRQALCNACNLNYRKSNTIPVLFHNLRGYDAHIICKALGKFPNHRLSCIGKNLEQYVTFRVGPLRFLDSFQFLNASLESLVQNLVDDSIDKFKATRQGFKGREGDIQMILKKGIYPYEHIDSFERFNETSLPRREAFFSTLTNKNISEEDYEHAQNVWRTFNIKNMGEYHDLYVLSDTLLLADVFESFRALSLEHDGIDPCHVFTAPGLAWESCLKMCKVELECLSDSEMYLFIEKGIRGGISVVTHHYAEANNKHLDEYDSNKESSYILYADACNLYGHSLRQSLPCDGFEWVSEPEKFILPEDSDGPKGWILEVDLECPPGIHDKLNLYPPCAEHLSVSMDMMSPYTKALAKDIDINLDLKTPKLIQHLNGVKNYVIHYKMLQHVLELGLVLKKVHKVLQFNQSPWMRIYVDTCTEMRKKATNDFSKNYWKLKVNAIYGRSLLNVRNHCQIEMVTDKKRALKLNASPALMTYKIYDEGFSAYQLKKVEIKMKTPIYIGFAVLDLSKYTMSDFYYNFMMKKYKNGEATLCLTDTDSFIFHIRTNNLYQDLKPHQDLFDCSVYPKDHLLYSDINKKVVGKFKDEYPTKIIKRVCAIRSKMYAVECNGAYTHKVGKGIARSTLKNDITYDDYENCLRNSTVKYGKMVSIRSRDHQLFTINQRKIALNPADTKRYQVDGIRTLAFGHYSIQDDEGPPNKRAKLK